MFLVMPSFAANSLTPNDGCSLVNEYSDFRISNDDLLTGSVAPCAGCSALPAGARRLGEVLFMRCSTPGGRRDRRQITGFIAVPARCAQTRGPPHTGGGLSGLVVQADAVGHFVTK